ncbi:hypothetical protein AUJ84_00750 [Candidatus Pacearchaeota archaeon CG1_02_32_132]|nr:MAG: hypothetical protein AUJ84_00750 [Candidatus Pacearchaeota archaeon CG1_02_32_132]
MKVLEMNPLGLAQVKELVGDLEEKKNLETYLKKFCKIKKEKAEALMEELNALDNAKIKEEFVVKIIDFLPKDLEELNKIFKEVSLDEKEANDILEIIKKY